jgi:Ca2+-binding RTX toxin-like protein
MEPFIAPLEPRRLFTADLTATTDVAAGTYLPGESVPVAVHVKNAGTALPIASSHRVVLSRNHQYGDTDDILVSSFTTPGLAANEVVNHAFNATLPQNIPAGSYYVIVKLDANNGVQESNEANVFFTDTPSIIVASNNLPSGPLTGTTGNDVILLSQRSGKLIVTFNGEARSGAVPTSLFIDAAAGNDKVIADATVTMKLAVTGGGGNDTIVGGSGEDELSGANGKDRVFGGAGNDFVIGGAQPDSLWGEAGNDLLLGAGGNDRLTDVVGRDWFIGGNGNDTIIARDTASDTANDPDTVSGNAGFDRAQVDTGAFPDTLASIEEILA